MTIKDPPPNGRVFPQFDANVPSNRQSAVYSTSPSWTNNQRTNSTMSLTGSMNARFPHIKDLQGKANALVRNIDSRMPVRRRVSMPLSESGLTHVSSVLC